MDAGLRLDVGKKKTVTARKAQPAAMIGSSRIAQMLTVREQSVKRKQLHVSRILSCVSINPTSMTTQATSSSHEGRNSGDLVYVTSPLYHNSPIVCIKWKKNKKAQTTECLDNLVRAAAEFGEIVVCDSSEVARGVVYIEFTNCEAACRLHGDWDGQQSKALPGELESIMLFLFIPFFILIVDEIFQGG